MVDDDKGRDKGNILNGGDLTKTGTYRVSGDYQKDVDSIGDGDPDCPKCRGRGVMYVTLDFGMPGTERCPCMYKKDLLHTLEMGWKGLVRAPKVPTSLLDEYAHQNMRITADSSLFRAHLRRTAINMGIGWNFRVYTDVDLVEAWLANVKVQGIEVLDGDVATRSKQQVRHLDIADLAEPPKLLIILLGTKWAPMRHTPRLLMQALSMRSHLSRPTWVVDQPHRRLVEGHVAYSEDLKDYLDYEWEHHHYDLSGHSLPRTQAKTVWEQPKTPVGFGDIPTGEEEYEDELEGFGEEEEDDGEEARRKAALEEIMNPREDPFSGGSSGGTKRAPRPVRTEEPKYKSKYKKKGGKR